jgi:hypothetical protein
MVPFSPAVRLLKQHGILNANGWNAGSIERGDRSAMGFAGQGRIV